MLMPEYNMLPSMEIQDQQCIKNKRNWCIDSITYIIMEHHIHQQIERHWQLEVDSPIGANSTNSC